MSESVRRAWSRRTNTICAEESKTGTLHARALCLADAAYPACGDAALLRVAKREGAPAASSGYRGDNDGVDRVGDESVSVDGG